MNAGNDNDSGEIQGTSMMDAAIFLYVGVSCDRNTGTSAHSDKCDSRWRDIVGARIPSPCRDRWEPTVSDARGVLAR